MKEEPNHLMSSEIGTIKPTPDESVGPLDKIQQKFQNISPEPKLMRSQDLDSDFGRDTQKPVLLETPVSKMPEDAIKDSESLDQMSLLDLSTFNKFSNVSDSAKNFGIDENSRKLVYSIYVISGYCEQALGSVERLRVSGDQCKWQKVEDLLYPRTKF